MRLISEFRRGTLFARTAITITAVSSLFLVFTLSLLAAFIVVPTAQRYAAALSSTIALSAHVWTDLSPVQQAAFRRELQEQYQLEIGTAPPQLRPRTRHQPFFVLLEQALEQRLGSKVTVLQSDAAGTENRYWVPAGDNGTGPLIGFEYSHRGLDPPITLLILIVAGVIASFLAAIRLARRLTRPLQQLTAASARLGSGNTIAPLQEQGPRELADLVKRFNDMSQQIRDLLANRTTLLAGISHDLRSPLTRMELALEILHSHPDPLLVEQLQKDVAQMDRLIGLFLEISRGLEEEQRQRVDIVPLLEEVVTDLRRTHHNLEWLPGPSCTKLLHPLALRRIVSNLLENAIRYGAGAPVTLQYRAEAQDGEMVVYVEVLDRGPGIPEQELEAVFRPFHRLEGSRSTETGGSGLGLSVVRQLAQANGCRVELLPRDGGGTCARITITGVRPPS